MEFSDSGLLIHLCVGISVSESEVVGKECFRRPHGREGCHPITGSRLLSSGSIMSITTYESEDFWIQFLFPRMGG